MIMRTTTQASYPYVSAKAVLITLQLRQTRGLRWLNTVLAVSEYMSFANLWQEKGCSSQAETWQVENILMKDFDSQIKFDIFVVSMAT